MYGSSAASIRGFPEKPSIYATVALPFCLLKLKKMFLNILLAK